MAITDTIPPRYPEDRPIEDDSGNWWVMHVKPNCERQVATYLLNREISYYLPIFKKMSRVGGLKRVRVTETPLFSGYICFALDKDRHHLLYDTKKLVRILKVEDQEGFVRELRSVAKAVESGNELTVENRLIPGRRVLILSGPLEGAEGVVVHRHKQSRLAVSVEMFNQSVLAKLDPDTQLEIL